MLATHGLARLIDMLKFSADAYGRAMFILGVYKGGEFSDVDGTNDPLSETDFRFVKQELGTLQVSAKTLGADCSLKLIDRLLNRMSTPGAVVTYGHIQGDFHEVESRLADELSARYLFALDARQAEAFQSGSFGENVEAQFPVLIDEIRECYKCYALERGTAAAFHAIRCLECGFAAMWRCLGIADPISGFERNWANRKKKVEEQMELKWPTKTGRFSGDAQLFDEALGLLAGLQNPYRNATMHFDAKYTLDEAWHIMELVKGFMRKIASRMDENGLPLA